MESQLVVLLGRDDDAFDDQNDADSDQSGPRYAGADLDKDVQRSVFRIPGVLHLSLPAADDEGEVEKMQKRRRKKKMHHLLTVGMSNSISSLAGIFT